MDYKNKFWRITALVMHGQEIEKRVCCDISLYLNERETVIMNFEFVTESEI